MDDLSAAISGFLSKPGAMDQVKAMAQSLGLGDIELPQRVSTPAQEPSVPVSAPASAQEPGLDLDPAKLQALLGALNSTSSDPSARLLEALGPLLRDGKREKLDRAVRALRLMGAARAVTKTIDL